jgi:hypothetical protein
MLGNGFSSAVVPEAAGQHVVAAPPQAGPLVPAAMPLDLLPEDREMLLRYASRPHRLPAHTKAKALLAAAQGMPEEQIALKQSIALHELAHLIIQYRSGGHDPFRPNKSF